MLLVVDIGNSRIKWALAEGGHLVRTGDVRQSDPDFETKLATAFAANPGISEARVASVAGSASQARVAALLRHACRAPTRLAVAAASGAGVVNGYTVPSQLGVDRWLAICAAWTLRRQAVCIVDAGTAVTIDVVTHDGRHQGGWIIPGLVLMKSALHQGTGDLRRLSGSAVPSDGRESIMGRDTAAAIALGTRDAIACAIRHCVETWQAIEPELALILCGGDADTIAPHLGISSDIRPHLVLEGLALDPPCFDAGA